MICERCGKDFDWEVEKEEFELELPSKSYNNLEKILCAKCAIDAIECLEDGVYFEYCERCGKKYDPITTECEFQSIHTNEYGTYASIFDMTNELLCLDCAIDEYNSYEDEEY